MSDALINGLAGAGGGIIAQLITYPLQTVNTRQQTDRDPKKSKAKPGTAQQIIQVVKNEGWGRLYSGLAPSLVGTAASQGVYYYFYQIFRTKAEAAARDRLNKGTGDGTVGMFSSLLVAAISGCVNVVLTTPIWMVVTRMQTHTKASAGEKPTHNLSISQDDDVQIAAIEHPPFATSHAVQEVYSEAGILGFWRGVFPTLVMVSNPSIQFMLYETLLKKLKAKRPPSINGNHGVTAMEVFLLGAMAKLGATVVTYPLLVVKARLQAKQVTGGDKKHHYKGTLDAILKMIRYEGLHGFYKGISTKIMQSVLAAAVLFMIKEELVKGARLLLTKNVVPINKVPLNRMQCFLLISAGSLSHFFLDHLFEENGRSSMYLWILSTGWWKGRAPVNPDSVLVIGFLCTCLILGFIYINRVKAARSLKIQSRQSLMLIICIASLYCMWCACQTYWRNPPQPAVGEEADLGVLVFLAIYFFLPHSFCIISTNSIEFQDATRGLPP